MVIDRLNRLWVVEYDPLPIPIRSCDWSGYLEDDPEAGCVWGRTAEDVIGSIAERGIEDADPGITVCLACLDIGCSYCPGIRVERADDDNDR